jgi:IS1 family transposase
MQPQQNTLQQPTRGIQAKQTGLFGHYKAQPENALTTLSNELNSVSRRLRMLEEHYTNLRRKTQLMDQNMLNRVKKFSTDFKTINSEISELRQMLADINNKILLIIRELRLCAKKEEVNVLQKYVSMWEPVNFITRKEVEDIIKDVLSKKEKERSKALKTMFEE